MNPLSQAACMCPWASSSLRSYRLLHKALPARETCACTMQNETFCGLERTFSSRTVPCLCKGKKSRPCVGQATGWSLTYNKAQSAPGPRGFRCAALPLHRSCGKAPHLGKGPWPTPRRREGEAGPAAASPPPLRTRAGSPRYGLTLGACRRAQRLARPPGTPRPPPSPVQPGTRPARRPGRPHSPGRARRRAWRKRTS